MTAKRFPRTWREASRWLSANCFWVRSSHQATARSKSISGTTERRPYRLLSLEVKTLEGIFFTDGLLVSTCFAHLHSGSQALKGEFLFFRLAMYFDSS